MTMQTVLEKWRLHSRENGFFKSTFLAGLILVAGVTLNTLAGIYATERASNSVTDIILSNTPVYNLDFLFVYGALFVIFFAFGTILLDPKRIPFTLEAMGLFYLTRALFVTLTHLGPFPTHAALDVGTVLSYIFGGGDLFFSGHTGAPFMLALLFWREIYLRYIFLAFSFTLGTVVLHAHLHYSIDVLSAFFITYGIYHIALWLFPEDARLFHRVNE